MRPIVDVAKELGLDPKILIPQGHYKAKIPLEAIRQNGKRGKMVVVTGITPTPAGEGKTTTVVGLTQGLGRLGKNVVATLREPSLGPIFGIKGGENPPASNHEYLVFVKQWRRDFCNASIILPGKV